MNTKLTIVLLSICISCISIGQTTIILQPDSTDGKDALVHSLHPTQNYTSFNRISAVKWTIQGTPAATRTYLEFDLSCIPGGANVTNATLTLFGITDPSSLAHSCLTGSNEYFVRRVTSLWDENTLIWNNQPSSTTLNEILQPPICTPNEDVEIDVTLLLNDAQTSSQNFLSLLIRLQTEIHYRSLMFASSDNANPNKRPKLEITYEGGNSIIEVDLGNDTTICNDESIMLDASQVNANYLWSDNSTNSTLTVNSSGIYWVEASVGCVSVRDTIQVTVIETPVIDLGNDTIICNSQPLTLNAAFPNANYLWSDGSTDPTLIVSSSGIYNVEVSVGDCFDTDEIEISANSQPFTYLGEDTTLCEGGAIILDVSQPDASEYLWQDGSTAPVFEITESGFYAVTVSNECGTAWDAVEVQLFSTPVSLDLGDDLILCIGDSIILDATNANGVEYEWNDGSQSSSIIVAESGEYQVVVKNECSKASDYINIIVENCCDFYIPNVFTPNFDGRNDEFRIYNSTESCKNITSFSLKVFDRWGEQVFETTDINTAWDGHFRGQKAIEGVYVWMLEYHDGIQYHLETGDVSILR